MTTSHHLHSSMQFILLNFMMKLHEVRSNSQPIFEPNKSDVVQREQRVMLTSLNPIVSLII